MSRGVNKVILVGTLGKDPETRYGAGGAAFTNFSIATNEEWKDKQTGETVKRTEWHNISVFGKLAEICGEYLRKGKQVYIEGSLRTEKYTTKDGVDKYTTKIICNEMQMLGGGGDNRQEQAPPSGQQSSRPAQSGSQRQAPKDAPPPDDFEGEIPF